MMNKKSGALHHNGLSHRSIHHPDFNKYRYLVKNVAFLKAVYITGILLWFMTVYGYVRFFMLGDSYRYIFAPLVFVLTIYYTISYGINLFYKRPDLAEHKRIVNEFVEGAHKPSVDIFLPVCGENYDVLHRTWSHVQDLDYPNFHVHVLDDKGDEQIEKMAKEYGFNYLSRPNKGHLKKAGNLKFGFDNSSSDFITIFDADFAPLPEFLNETVPYMLLDEKIAILQTPQHFEVHKNIHSKSWLQYGAGAVQEDFYRIIQVARNTLGGAICVGTNAVYRREALAKIGGTAQIEHSEDVWTGVLVINKGYNVCYKPYILAEGYCPDDFVAFFKQQYRWCKGSMSLMISKIFRGMKKPWYTKLCYISGFLYYIHSLTTYFLPFCVFVLLSYHFYDINLVNAIPFIPYTIFGLIALPLYRLHGHKIGVNLSRYGAFSAYTIALLHTIGGRNMERTPTGSKSKNSMFDIMFVGNLIYFLIYLVIVSSFAIMGKLPLLNYQYYSVLFWVFWNIIMTGMFLIASGHDAYIKEKKGSNKKEKRILGVSVSIVLVGLTLASFIRI